MRKVKKGIAMATLSLKVLNREGRTICVSRGEDYVSLVCTAEYQEGDMIILESSVKNIHVQWQADDAMGPAFCFITDNVLFKIPFGEKRISYSPKAFSGNRHYLYARVAREDEVSAYRNLALNVNDQHGDTRCYPMLKQEARLCLPPAMPLTACAKTVPMGNGHTNPGGLTGRMMRK